MFKPLLHSDSFAFPMLLQLHVKNGIANSVATKPKAKSFINLYGISPLSLFRGEPLILAVPFNIFNKSKKEIVRLHVIIYDGI